MTQIKNTKVLTPRYKKSTWTIVLQDGCLTCKGPGYGKWGTRAISVATSVTDFWAGVSSSGPVILFQVNDKHYIKKFKAATGDEITGGFVFEGTPSRVVVDPHENYVNFYITLENGRNIQVYIDGFGQMNIE